MPIKELRLKSSAELSGLLKETQRELFKLRMQVIANQCKSPHLLRLKRREIARLHTLLAQQTQEVSV